MQTEWFHSFVETIRMGSLSKAGDRLNLSQTALTKQIRNLEDAFGVTLFRRTSAGMELTSEGQLLYEKVQVWLKDMEDTKHQLSNLKSINHVIIGCLPSLAAFYLPPKVLNLKSVGVRVDIQVYHTSNDIRDAFLAGDIDIAILDGSVHLPKIYPCEDLFSEPYYTVVPNSHTLRTRPCVMIEDIAKEPFVLHPQQCDIRKTLNRVIGSIGIEPHVTEEVPFGETILGFVAAGGGITVVPKSIADHSGNANVTSIPIADFGAERTVCFVAKSDEQFDFLKRYLRKNG